jgi:hypothetical protein
LVFPNFRKNGQGKKFKSGGLLMSIMAKLILSYRLIIKKLWSGLI